MRAALDEAPASWRSLGDLAGNPERALLHSASDDSLAFREACTRTMDAMRTELAGTTATPRERWLADRMVACWLARHYAETVYDQSMGETSRPWAQLHRQRIDRAHRRYMAAIKALAQVRWPLVPPAQINLTG